MRRKSIRVTYDFWGTGVGVTAHPADDEDLDFFFGSYEVPNGSPTELEIDLECASWPDRGFFRSLLSNDGLTKRVSTKDATGAESSQVTSREFTGWSEAASPLPPIGVEPLRSRFATVPGTSFSRPDGKVILLVGANYVGKTSTLLSLASRGCLLISDGVIFFDVGRGGVVPFRSTLGLRGNTLLEYQDHIGALPFRETISPVTGLVVLLRQIDVVAFHREPCSPIDGVIAVTRRDIASTRDRTVRTPRLPWFHHGNVRAVGELLPPTTRWLDVPLKTTPSQLTELIIGES